jgi:hypothetical protein
VAAALMPGPAGAQVTDMAAPALLLAQVEADAPEASADADESDGGAETEEITEDEDVPEPIAPEELGRGGRLVFSGEGAAFGAALGLVNLPQEADFEGGVPTYDLYMTWYRGPWWNYRIGINHQEGRFEGFALSTDALYAAYLARGALTARFGVYAMLGAAFHRATLNTAEGEAQSASGAGPLAGAGLHYGFDALVLGLQMLVLSHTGDFGGTTVATGSNQVQLTFEFPLD